MADELFLGSYGSFTEVNQALALESKRVPLDTIAGLARAEDWPHDLDMESNGRPFGLAFSLTDDDDDDRVFAAWHAVSLFRTAHAPDSPVGLFGPFDEDGAKTWLFIGHQRSRGSQPSVSA